MSATKFIAATLVVGCLAIPVPGEASGAEEARQAFNKGLSLYQEGRFGAATEAFRRAYQLQPSWKLFYNIGQCEAVQKRYGLALDAFESYLVEGGDDVHRLRQQEVRDELARLRDLSGELEVLGPPAVLVFVDGLKRGETPLLGNIRVASGVHQVKLVQGSEVLLEREVKIVGRRVYSLSAENPEPAEEQDIGPGPDSNPPPPPAPAPPLDKPEKKQVPWRPLGWASLGAGALTVIAGAITGGMALSLEHDLEKSCPDNRCLADKDLTRRDRASNLALATDILLPLGGVLVATGVVLLVIERTRKEPLAARITPVYDGQLAGLMVECEF